MAIDESDFLLGVALAAALPYALTALVDWGRRHPTHFVQHFLQRLGAGIHRHG